MTLGLRLGLSLASSPYIIMLETHMLEEHKKVWTVICTNTCRFILYDEQYYSHYIHKQNLLSLSSMVTVVVEDVKLSVTPGGSLEASWAVNC